MNKIILSLAILSIGFGMESVPLFTETPQSPSMQTGSTKFRDSNLYACPRCRRNQPKGPRKRPTPPVTKNAPSMV